MQWRKQVNLADHLSSEAAVKVGGVERLHGRRGAHERWLKNRLVIARKHSPKLERLEKLLLLDLGCAPCAQPSQRVANQQALEKPARRLAHARRPSEVAAQDFAIHLVQIARVERRSPRKRLVDQSAKAPPVDRDAVTGA